MDANWNRGTRRSRGGRSKRDIPWDLLDPWECRENAIMIADDSHPWWWAGAPNLFGHGSLSNAEQRGQSRWQIIRGDAARRSVGLPLLVLGFVTAAMPEVYGLRHMSDALAADEKEIIAAQIRKQGFACDKPASAAQDSQRSRPHETLWVLECKNASYRVRLVPKMAAQVHRLD